jgi:hypothetical protein
MRNISDRRLEKIKMHIICSVPPKNFAVCEMMGKNIVEPEKLQMAI